MTELILLVVIIMEGIFIVYQDQAARKERESFHLKIMSKDVIEYRNVSEKQEPSKAKVEEQTLYLDPDEVDPRVLLGADDNL